MTTHYHWPDGEGNINDEQARALKHGYYACVSYTDAQIGLLQDALEESGMSDNTIVLLWDDPGENVNVASRYPAVTDSLESVLDRAVFFE